MLRISIHTEGESPKVVEFPYDQRVSFGRADDNDVVLPPAYVSRQHGEFVFEDGVWWVIDRGSLTGMAITTADGVRRQLQSGAREPLTGGEAIEILHTMLRVEVKPIESLLPFEQEWWEDSGATVASIASVRSDAVRGLQRQLVTDSHKLETLFELAKDLNQVQTTDEVLHRIGTTVFETLPTASHFSVCVLGSSGAFEPHLGLLRGGGVLGPGEIPVSRSLLGWVAARRMAVLYRPGDHTGLSKTLALQNVASSMAVPLHGAKGPVGVMLVDNRTTESPFDEADLNLMIVLASSAARALERARLEADIQRMFNGFVEASVTAIEARDPASGGHSRRVADYTLALAEAVNRSRSPILMPFRLTQVQLRELSYAALLHDFGKVGVAECVLQKSERLYPKDAAIVESRFRELRILRHNALLSEALDACDGHGADPRARLAEVEDQMRQLGAELEAGLALVRRASRTGRLSEAQRERLEALARWRFVDADGCERALLEAEHFEALCIPEGTLCEQERRAIESHVLESQRFLQQIPWSSDLERIPEIVVAHHEKLDGSGYPYGLRGDQILPQTRMLTLCDIFDAITSADRPYRAALPFERGLDELHQLAREGRVEACLVDVLAAVRPWDRTRAC
jgi:3',5'-cyclic-nucleotide phosphodiesterase